MREIKFRAWDNVKDRMYYCGEESEVCFEITSTGILGTDITSDEEEFKKLHHLKYMKYTGLKDTNKTEIYEGDIATLYNGELAIIEEGSYKDSEILELDNDYYYGEPGERNSMGFHVKTIKYHECYSLDDKTENWITVIGSIYENPELLEGGEK